MSKSLLKTLSVSACLAWSGLSFAVGLGGINVTSGLGEKLKADIDLVAVTKAEKSSLVARLASPDTYKNASLDYPYNNKFRFEVANRADGASYLKVTSDQPVNDPFVVVMVELNWASGRLVRDYTFLLDPPGYTANQPAPAEVQPVAPVVEAAPIAPTPVETIAPVAQTPPAVVVEPVTAVAAPEPTPAPAQTQTNSVPTKSTAPAGRFDIAGQPAAAAKTAKSTTASKAASDSYVVQRGDSLAKIATDEVSSNVSLERTLVALYRANANQFDGQNMNRLSVGKTLRLPSEAELAAVKQADAVTEIRAQAEDWNAYRQKLASAATPSKQSQTTQQVATGKINSAVSDKAPVVKQSATEVLKLSKGEAPGDKAAAAKGGKAASVQDKKNAAQEEAIAKEKALKEGQARAALLDKNLKDMEKLAQLKVEAAALAQKQTPAPAPVANEPKTVATMAASAVAAAKDTKQMPKPQTKSAPKPEPSLLDSVMSDPMYMAGGGAGLLGLLGLGWFAARRKKQPAFEDTTGSFPDAGSGMSSVITAPTPSPDTGDFTQKVETPAQAISDHDDVDPISEADLFLNFGRDAQAEDILKEALAATPNNHQIHLKLLGIYAKRKDLAEFENIARQLKDSGDEAAFAEASEIGRGIDPRNELYGGAPGFEDASSATMQVPSFAVAKPAEVVSPSVDFDLDAESTGKHDASPEHHFLDDSQKTMSITAAAPEAPKTTNLDDLIFDVTGSHPTMKMDKFSAKSEAEKVEDKGMEFTLDIPTEPVAKVAQASKATTIDFPSMDLNLDAHPATGQSLPQEHGELWQEVATKLDLAKAYQEMGDDAGAKEILEEVLREGDAEQQQSAQELIRKIA